MAKNIRRMLAKVLVLCMILSALPLQALATEGEGEGDGKVNIEVTTPSGSVTLEAVQDKDTTTTKDTTTGNTTTTTTTVTEAKDSSSSSSSNSIGNASGTVSTTVSTTTKTEVEYKETKTDSVTTNSNGDQIAQAGSTDGKETVTETTETTQVTTKTEKGEEVSQPSTEVEAGKDNVFTDENNQPTNGTLSGSVGTGDNKVVATPVVTPPEGIPVNPDGSWTETEEISPPETLPTETDGSDPVTSEDGSTTTTTTTTKDTTIEKFEETTTKVEVTNRELLTGGLKVDGPTLTEGDPVEGSKFEQIDSEKVEVDDSAWSALDAEDHKDIIDLAKEMATAKGEFTWPEDKKISDADKAIIEALAAEAKKDNDAVKTLLGLNTAENAGETTEPDVITAEIKEVNLTVGSKVETADEGSEASEGSEGSEGSETADVYNAALEFEIHLSKNILGTTVVTIMQGGKEIAKEPLSMWNPDVSETGANAYKVKLEGLQLAEGEVDLDITLENVDQVTTEKVFVATVKNEVEVPIDPNTNITENTHESNSDDKQNGNGNDRPTDEGKSTVSWGAWDSYNGEITVGDAKIAISTASGDANQITFTADETITMKEIVLETASGTFTYPIPEGVLIAGKEYTISGFSYPESDDPTDLPSPETDHTGVGRTEVGLHMDEDLGLAQGGFKVWVNGTAVKVPVMDGNGKNAEPVTDADGNVIMTDIVGTFGGNSKNFNFDMASISNTLKKGDKVVIEDANGKKVTIIIGLQEGNSNSEHDQGHNNYKASLHKLGITFNGGEKTPGTTTETVNQTILGTRQDTQKVSLNMGMNFNFAVNEATVTTSTKTDKIEKTTTFTKKIVETVRTWKDSFSKETPAVVPPTVPPIVPAAFDDEPAPQPQVFRLANQNVEEIPEEPVPLAAPVITGDNSFLWIAVVVLSLFAMAVINFTGKKGKYEAF